MSSFIHHGRSLTATALLVGLCLTGGSAASAATGESTPSTSTIQTQTAGRQWAIDLDHGPDAGGTTVTLTPPETGRITQMSAGGNYPVTIDSNGNLYTWGNNYFDELGRDTNTTPSNRPGMVTKPAGIDRWTQADAGYNHSLAIGSDGNLYTWGNNYFDKLGRDTNTTPSERPGMVTKPAGIDRWTQADAGYNHSLAIGSDGNLYTWGNNSDGELGRDTGSTGQDATPGMVTKPAGVDKWTQADAGYNHSLAIGSDGNLYTWGNNSDGKLGRDTGSTGQDATPGMVTKPAGVDKWIQAGAGENYSLAIGSDGNLYTWGNNNFDKLGRDTNTTPSDRPGMVTKPAGIDRWTQADAGYSHSLAIGSDGNLYTWGRNSDGKLGRDTGSAGQDATPGMVTKPAGVDKWTRAGAGENYSLATDSDGNLYTWGYSLLGALGRDTDSVSPNGRPGRVAFPDQIGLADVRFDGIAGVGLTAKTDGTWSVSTPSHAAGTVTVTVTWTLNGVVQPDEHLTYTYEAPVATRTVAFDPAGGSAVSAQRVMDGQKAVRPADPTRDGYRFNGWFNGTDPYDFDQPVTGDLTLTAHWTRSADEKPTTPTQKPTTPTQKPTRPTQKPTRPAKPEQKPTKPTDPTQKPIDHTQQPTGPADNPNPSGVLSSTGSDTAPILAAGILTLAAGILTLVSIRTGRRIAHGSSTK